VLPKTTLGHFRVSTGLILICTARLPFTFIVPFTFISDREK
jgi:hypothetical protein